MWALWLIEPKTRKIVHIIHVFKTMLYVIMYVLLAFILRKVSQSMKIIPPCVCDRVSCVFQVVRHEGAMYLVTGLRCDAASRINFLMCFFPKATNYRQTDTPTFVRPSTRLYTCGIFERGQTAQAIQAINEKQGIGCMAPSNMKLEKSNQSAARWNYIAHNLLIYQQGDMIYLFWYIFR